MVQNWWEQDQVVSPGGVPRGITIGTPRAPDPNKELTAQRTRQQIDQDAATEGARIREANARAAKAEADAIEAQRTLSSADTPDPELATAIKNLGLDELMLSVNAARQEIGTGRATGVTGALARMIPGTTANDFSGSLDSIQGAVIMEKLQALKDASKTGASGMGALSEREGARLAASIAALGPNMSAEKLLTSLATIERHALALKAVAAGENPDDPEIAKKYGIAVEEPKKAAAAPPTAGRPGAGGAPPTKGDGPVNPAMTLSKGDTETVIDPALAGVNSKVASMIKAGKSAKQVREYLNSVEPGLGALAQNIDEWVKFSRQNPNKPIGVILDRVDKPLTPAGSLLNDIAQSGPGAFTMGAADVLTAGTLDNMTDNPALARAGMAGVAQENPNWTLAGQVMGGGLAGLGAEAAAARAGLGGLGSVLAGDALPAAAYGAGSADDGDRLTGAGLAALTGIGGGVIGRGTGRLVSGTADPAVQFLAERGIRMTPGQLIGGVPKRIEEAMSSLPFLGEVIRNQRVRGVEDFNRAAFGEALEPIGQAAGQQIGEAGVGEAENLIGQAYRNALGGSRVSVDPQFGTDLGGAVTAARALPRVGEEVADSLGEIIPPYFNMAGELTGENMQPLLRELRQFRSGYRTDPLGTRVAGRVGEAEDAITGMFERQAPDVMPQFNAANEAYSRFAPIQDAVLAAKNTDGRFMPSQLGTAVVAGTKKYAGKGAAARGDRAFFDLQRNAQNVMPSTLPDSGTATRMLIPGALGLAAGGGAGYAADGADGAGAGMIGTAALGTALLSPYAARALLQKALTAQRPDAVINLGEFLGRSRLPGALAVPLLATGQ